MSSNKEMMANIKHDVNGTCAQLQAALPLLEQLLKENEQEAMELIKEMSDSAKRLSDKILFKSITQ